MKFLCRYSVFYFAYCETCKTYQLAASTRHKCAFCNAHIDWIEGNRMLPPPLAIPPWNEYEIVHWLSDNGHINLQTQYQEALLLIPQLHKQPNGSLQIYGQGLTIAERVEKGKKLFICAPKEEHGLWWDYPGTVGQLDGVQERCCYIDNQLVFRLETGPCGRLFIYRDGALTWAQTWCTSAIAFDWCSTHMVLEVDLRHYFHQGKRKPDAFNTFIALMLAPDVLTTLPGCCPLGGFEFGFMRRIPENYLPTYDMPLNAEQRAIVMDMTYQNTVRCVISNYHLLSIPIYMTKYWYNFNNSPTFSYFFWTRIKWMREAEMKQKLNCVLGLQNRL